MKVTVIRHIFRERYRYAIGCIAVLLVSLQVSAADVDYPCRGLVESGEYEQALSELQQLKADSSKTYAVNFALYKVYVARQNPHRDLRSAYICLNRSQEELSDATEQELQQAEQLGFTLAMYNAEMTNVCLFGMLEAQSANTIDSWDEFLIIYKRAPQKQRDEATRTRNTLAFDKAARLNTVEAYRQYVATYPQAEERPEAEKRLYELSYKQIADSGSEDDYLQYCRDYPNSPYVSQARDRAAELEMRRLVQPDDWRTLRDYLELHADSTRWRDTVMSYLARIVRRTYRIEAAKWGMANMQRPYSDSCWLTLRHTYLEDTTLQMFVRFHDMYRSKAIEPVQQADRQLVEAHERYRNGKLTAEQFILLTAPTYPAYYKLQSLIREDIKARRWPDALATVRSFRQVFAGDRRFADLMRVLQELDDPHMVPKSVGQGVNTQYGNEFCPAITADGKQLYFCGTRRVGNIGGEDIFVSKKTGNNWGKAVALNELNSADANEAPLALSADGTTMIAFRSGKLMVSHLTQQGWSPLEPLSPNIAISQWQADAMITSDGKALLFAAMSQTPHEQQMSINIFVSLMQDNGEWGQPIDLGPTINTPRIDRSPFLHPDMKTLYFCSEGHGSLGKTDVFVSTRLNEHSWTEWSEPVNMGKVINTVGNECWYKISTDGTQAYFSKRVNGQNDLFQLSIPKHLQPKPVATLSGRVTDQQGLPVVTTIRWEDLETQRLVGQTRTDPNNGSFFIVLPEGKNYGYYIADEMLFPVSGNIDLRKADAFIAMETNIAVAAIDAMITDEIAMPMNNLFFNSNECVLLPASVAELNRIASVIRQQQLFVEISGHTDNQGNDEANRLLSKNRANAVRDYLVELGVGENLIITQGYGKSRPVASNKTPEGRQQNRRVELKFIKQ